MRASGTGKLRILWYDAAPYGEVAEWPKAHAWKVCNGQPFESSNLSLTAIK